MAEIKKITQEELEQIRKLIESVRYGAVNIIIQDGKIVQIDKNEKIRL
ncbi:MAG: YezD family protein [Lachnospiraceae bacterium]|nr:YezD family protein [Lachnospiraceae bacterium]